MSFASNLLVLLMGCSAAAPPAGPKHKPASTEESATDCPQERERAQNAREELLGSEDPALRREAAARVLEHGICEALSVTALPAPTGTQDQILVSLRGFRTRTQDAVNLFGEVRRYGQELLSGRSLVEEGAAKIQFARIVAAIVPPAELDVRSKAEFEEELAFAVVALQGEAEVALLEALQISGAHENGAEVRRDACRHLEQIGKSSAWARD